jgi:hypothetical protein
MAPTVDAFTVRGKREERRGEKEGHRGVLLSSCRPWHPTGTAVALAGIVPRMAAGSEVGDGADGRGPFVNRRERERGGSR